MSKKMKERNSGSTIWVTDFDDESCIRFHAEVWQAFTEDPTGPIVIHIDSPGGSAYSLLSMWATMDNIRAIASDEFFFITYVHGQAFSCGILLASHGDLRVATPASDLMYHEVSDSFRGREHQIDINHENLKRFTEKVYTVFTENTNFKGGVTALREWGEKDRWLTPQEAKDLGIIDIVGYIKPRQQVVTYTPPSIGKCDLLSLRRKKSKEKEEVVVKKPTRKKSNRR
jgi:ATP-dependent Clp protease protease subunit